MATQYELGVIGAGNMSEGIIAAVIKQNVYPPEKIIVADPDPQRLELFAGEFGIVGVADNRQMVAASKRIMLAVKPQIFDGVAAGIEDLVTEDHLLISILAGMTTTRLAAAFGNIRPRIVRVMPNLPIRVGAGTAGLCAGEFATRDDLADVEQIFAAGGAAVVLQDENLLDAVTAISGSGPAYFYYFVEALVEGGKACGLAEEDALKLAEQTCLGAARMMLETGEPPTELRRKVTSKGGVTQAALEHMESNRVKNSIHDAVKAAVHRCRELGA
jgi:pyrroline-5-carboxylate reductase